MTSSTGTGKAIFRVVSGNFLEMFDFMVFGFYATAIAMLEEADRCRAAGMNQCLIKPFSMRALYTCLLAYKRNADEAL